MIPKNIGITIACKCAKNKIEKSKLIQIAYYYSKFEFNVEFWIILEEKYTIFQLVQLIMSEQEGKQDIEFEN